MKVADPQKRAQETKKRKEKKREKAKSNGAQTGMNCGEIDDDVEIVAVKTIDEVLAERTEYNKLTGRYIVIP